MASLIQQFEERGVKIEEIGKELMALREASESFKAEATDTIEKQAEQIKAMQEAEGVLRAEMESAVKAADDYKAESEKRIADLEATIAQQKAAMALAPLGDVSAGQKPIADGSSAEQLGDSKERRKQLKEQVQKLSGKEQMEFYLAHKHDIDQSYKD